MSELNWIRHDGGPMPVPGDTIVATCLTGNPDDMDNSYSARAGLWSYWGEYTHYAIVGDVVDVAAPTDAVNSPAHYTSGDIECIDAIKAQMSADEFAGYLRGNVVKYMWRYRDKGGVKSLEKARWYLERLIGELAA